MKITKDLWQRRWKALENNLYLQLDIDLREFFSNRETALSELIHRLHHFAKEQFWFFHDGLITRQTINLLPIVDQQNSAFHTFNVGYPITEHILSTILGQIAEDATVLQRASQQREISIQSMKKGGKKEGDVIYTLTDIDRLALHGLNMLEPYLPSRKISTAITYFQRSANVRVIPYAPVALIGVPLTTLGVHNGFGVVEDLLAIPHELGHHVYWNGSIDGSTERSKRFHRIIPTKLYGSAVEHWAEEIFCDVIGCLVGGPAIARSFLEMQLSEIGDRLTNRATTHPTPELRPLLYAKILEMIGLPTSAAEINVKWNDILEQRRVYVDRTTLFAAYDAVDSILQVLEPDLDDFRARQWSEDGAYEDVYQSFKERRPQAVEGVLAQRLDRSLLGRSVDWRTLGDRLLEKDKLSTLPSDWTDKFNQEHGATEPNACYPTLDFSPEEWLTIFDFDAWITAGPRVRAH